MRPAGRNRRYAGSKNGPATASSTRSNPYDPIGAQGLIQLRPEGAAVAHDDLAALEAGVIGQERHLAFAADRRHHARAQPLEDGQRVQAYATRGRLHEHGVTGLARAQFADGIPRGDGLHRERGPVREAPTRRQGMEISRVGIDERRIASEAGQADDAIARRDRGDALAHGLDSAGKLEAGYEGALRRGRVEPQARGQIGEVESDGADGHAGVPGWRGLQLLCFPAQPIQRSGPSQAPHVSGWHRSLRRRASIQGILV